MCEHKFTAIDLNTIPSWNAGNLQYSSDLRCCMLAVLMIYTIYVILAKSYVSDRLQNAQV